MPNNGLRTVSDSKHSSVCCSHLAHLNSMDYPCSKNKSSRLCFKCCFCLAQGSCPLHLCTGDLPKGLLSCLCANMTTWPTFGKPLQSDCCYIPPQAPNHQVCISACGYSSVYYQAFNWTNAERCSLFFAFLFLPFGSLSLLSMRTCRQC